METILNILCLVAPILIGLGVLYEVIRPSRKRLRMTQEDVERTLELEEMRRSCRK